MNARGTDEEVFACVLTCGVSARRTDGGGRRSGVEDGAMGCAGRGKRRARERGACPPGRAPEHSRGNTRASGSSRVRKRVGEVVRSARGAGKARRGLKSVSARCTCPTMYSYNVRDAWRSLLADETIREIRLRRSSIDRTSRPMARKAEHAHYVIGLPTREIVKNHLFLRS